MWTSTVGGWHCGWNGAECGFHSVCTLCQIHAQLSSTSNNETFNIFLNSIRIVLSLTLSLSPPPLTEFESLSGLQLRTIIVGTSELTTVTGSPGLVFMGSVVRFSTLSRKVVLSRMKHYRDRPDIDRNKTMSRLWRSQDDKNFSLFHTPLPSRLPVTASRSPIAKAS